MEIVGDESRRISKRLAEKFRGEPDLSESGGEETSMRADREPELVGRTSQIGNQSS